MQHNAVKSDVFNINVFMLPNKDFTELYQQVVCVVLVHRLLRPRNANSSS